jgi:hypothetical protein
LIPKKKSWHISFRDEVIKGESLETVHTVESYKEYNLLEEGDLLGPDNYRGCAESRLRLLKIK